MKKLIGLVVLCGFLLIGIGCSTDTKSTKVQGQTGSSATKAETKKTP